MIIHLIVNEVTTLPSAKVVYVMACEFTESGVSGQYLHTEYH